MCMHMYVCMCFLFIYLYFFIPLGMSVYTIQKANHTKSHYLPNLVPSLTLLVQINQYSAMERINIQIFRVE